MFLEKFRHWIKRLKSLYRRQPEIISVRPIGFTNPIKKISLEAVVLDSDLTDRTLTKIGTSIGVTFKKAWETQIVPPFHIHLLQTDKKAVLVEEVGNRE